MKINSIYKNIHNSLSINLIGGGIRHPQTAEKQGIFPSLTLIASLAIALLTASCGKENDLHPLYSSPTDSSLYYTMLGDHAWLGIYDPDNQSFTETWANSFVRFTADSVIFSHMVLTFSDTWDSTWYEARPVVAHAYTFRPPDTYFFDSIRYVVDAYPQHGCVYFWGEDGYAYSVAKERTQLSNK